MAQIQAAVRRLREVMLLDFDDLLDKAASRDQSSIARGFSESESRAIERAEKACERYNEVRERPHTAKELGEAMRECLEAKHEAERELSKPDD